VQLGRAATGVLQRLVRTLSGVPVPTELATVSDKQKPIISARDSTDGGFAPIGGASSVVSA
jgi:hypothetical protein